MNAYDNAPFSGSKIALFCNGEMIAYQRDDFAHIPFPGMWDLPGGAREGDETPVDCALREVAEEFGIALSPDQVVWMAHYPGDGAAGHWFLVGEVTAEQVAAISFGSEGQTWAMMDTAAFVACETAVPQLRARLAGYLAGRAT